MRRVSLLHEPSALAPLNKIVLGEQSWLSRCAYVVAAKVPGQTIWIDANIGQTWVPDPKAELL